MSDYVKMTVKISKEDLKDYLLDYLTEEEIENTNLQNEATDIVNGILQDYFSDFMVYDENCRVIGYADVQLHQPYSGVLC